MSKSSTRFVSAILATASLSACGGEDISSGSSAGSSSSATLPFTTSSTLLASFLDNLDSVRTAATQLITTDVRYLLQDAPSGYYADINGNSSYDAGVDVLLRSSPLKHSGIHYAHAAGLTGSGETIAVSDSGFLTSHEAFAGKSLTTGSSLSTTDHGTFVASIAAGDSSNMIGVAPGADLILGSYNTLTQLTETANAATSAGAVAYNNSWGFVGQAVDTASYNSVFAGASGAAYLNALENYATDGIVLFAASNDYDATSVGLMAGLPALESDLEDSWLAVVSGVPVMVDDDIISAQRVSGACLEAAKWCIAADGTWTGATASSTDSYEFGSGTSFATPTVSGALALLAEAFPTMSHQDLRVRLLASADNDFTGFSSDGTVELVSGFDHEYSDEWGHGFLDVAAALLPIGQSTITTSTGVSFDPENALVVTGRASGDAVSKALTNLDIVSVDGLSAQFSVSASALVVDSPVSPMFSNADVTNFYPLQNASVGTAAFFGDGLEIPGVWEDSDASLAIYQRSETGQDTFGFGVSRLFDLDGATLEVSTAFGGDTGALMSDWTGGSDASIFSTSLAFAADLSSVSQIRFEAGYAAGRETTVFGETSDVLMNSAAISLTGQSAFTRNDRFGLTLSMPAAVTRGSTRLGLPVSTESGAVAYQSVPIDLSPDKREVRLAFTYERPVSRNGYIGLSIAHAQNRGNIAGKRETGLMVSFKRHF